LAKYSLAIPWLLTNYSKVCIITLGAINKKYLVLWVLSLSRVIALGLSCKGVNEVSTAEWNEVVTSKL